MKTKNGNAIALDALHIKVSGSTGVHLTVVDLPGLISVPKEEPSNEDINTVHRLINGYLKSSRTIILAAVQARNDVANQSVIQKAEIFDPEGARAVGIIFKPDLINEGSETPIAQLANNEDNIELKLGFFLLAGYRRRIPSNLSPFNSRNICHHCHDPCPWLLVLWHHDRQFAVGLQAAALTARMRTYRTCSVPRLSATVRRYQAWSSKKPRTLRLGPFYGPRDLHGVACRLPKGAVHRKTGACSEAYCGAVHHRPMTPGAFESPEP